MKNISVIGAETMGNGIAHTFAQHHFKVNLIDVSQKALNESLLTIEKNLNRLIEKGKINNELKQTTLNNLTLSQSLPEGVKKADLAIEAASEYIDLKLDIFKQLDQFTPDHCILASNTSSISLTKIASATNRKEKVIGMHFMNPAPIMNLAEVIRGYSTSHETTHTVMQLAEQLEKLPVEVNDYPDFVSNRILMPMINEAIETLFEGVADVEEIDQVMTLGMAHPMGPLQLADFIGLDVCLSILRVMYEGFKRPKYAPCQLLVNMVEAGNLGKKSGQGFYQYKKGIKELIVAERFKK